MNSVFSKWSSFFISFHWDVSQKVFDRYRDKYTDKWIYIERDHNVPTHTSLTILYFFLTFLILFPYFFLLYLLYFVHFFPWQWKLQNTAHFYSLIFLMLIQFLLFQVYCMIIFLQLEDITRCTVYISHNNRYHCREKVMILVLIFR